MIKKVISLVVFLLLANAGIRVDLQGNIYLGLLYWPKSLVPPKGFAKDYAWEESVGSVVKFSP